MLLLSISSSNEAKSGNQIVLGEGGQGVLKDDAGEEDDIWKA